MFRTHVLSFLLQLKILERFNNILAQVQQFLSQEVSHAKLAGDTTPNRLATLTKTKTTGRMARQIE